MVQREDGPIGVCNTIHVMALDAITEFYPYIGFERANAIKAHQIFIDVNKGSDFAKYHTEMNPYFYAYIAEKLSQSDRTFLARWIDENSAVNHVSDLDLSCWDGVLHTCIARGWSRQSYTEAEAELVAEMIDAYEIERDRRGFIEMVEEARDRPGLTDWDLVLHTKYDFNYFDDTGFDPFITLKGIRWAYALRKFVRDTPYLQRPDFPYEKFHEMGAEMFRAADGWLPAGVDFCDIRELRTKRHHDF